MLLSPRDKVALSRQYQSAAVLLGDALNTRFPTAFRPADDGPDSTLPGKIVLLVPRTVVRRISP